MFGFFFYQCICWLLFAFLVLDSLTHHPLNSDRSLLFSEYRPIVCVCVNVMMFILAYLSHDGLC